MLTYIVIFVFLIILVVLVMYLVHTYAAPKKIEEIERMIDNGQTKLAMKKLNSILEKDDRNAYAHYFMAKAYSKEGNSQYAIVEYRQVLKLGRFDSKIKEVEIRTELAAHYKIRKNLEEAKKEYLILTKIDPSNYNNYYELGLMFYNSGITEKAAGFFKKSVASNSQHGMSHYYLGQIHLKNGLHQDAKQMFLNSIKVDPTAHRSHYFLGVVLRQQGDYEWAIKEFDIAQKDDELKVKCFLAKGMCYVEKGQHPKAIQEFERGLKFARKGSDAEFNLRYFMADCQEKMRDLHSAIANWEKIIKVNPRFKDVPDKLQKYSEFRQDDSIKDFLIVGLSQFEHKCRKIAESMDLKILDVEIISDTEIELIVIDSGGKWRNTRQMNKIIRVIRRTDSIPESFLRKLHEGMKLKNATRIVIITTGDFPQKTIDYANTRPIELLGKSELITLLKKV